MSSLPDSDGVKRIRVLLRRSKELSYELSHVRAISAKLGKLEDDLRKTNDAVIKALDEMDCHSSGNAGWERRVTWMLAEMLSQEAEEVRSTLNES